MDTRRAFLVNHVAARCPHTPGPRCRATPSSCRAQLAESLAGHPPLETLDNHKDTVPAPANGQMTKHPRDAAHGILVSTAPPSNYKPARTDCSQCRRGLATFSSLSDEECPPMAMRFPSRYLPATAFQVGITTVTLPVACALHARRISGRGSSVSI